MGGVQSAAVVCRTARRHRTGDAADAAYRASLRRGAARVQSVSILAVVMWRSGGALRRLGVVLAELMLLQIALGVALIVVPPQLALTVAHDVTGALLLATVTAVAYRLRAG
jgi:heme A synthase